MDLLYASVDKQSSTKKGAEAINPIAPEAHTATDQLYAQVDKKKTKKNHAEYTSHQGSEDIDQLYAQVDKKQHKKKCEEVSEDSIEESGAVYSVVNKPKAPQLPPKSDLLMEELYN